jgi:hypothetical protein
LLAFNSLYPTMTHYQRIKRQRRLARLKHLEQRLQLPRWLAALARCLPR